MATFFDHLLAHFSPLQMTVWSAYLVAAVMLPVYHVPPILRYLRGNAGIGDACIRTEAIQCAWRVPALLFSMLVTPSLPLFLSISLDMVGRIGRVLAMQVSQGRWHAAQTAGRFVAPNPTIRESGHLLAATARHEASRPSAMAATESAAR